MLMARLRLEEEMHEKPCEECEEQNRNDACGQIILRRGDGVVDTVDAGDCAQHGQHEVNQFLHCLPFLLSASSYRRRELDMLIFPFLAHCAL